MPTPPLCHRLLRPHTPAPVSRDEEVNTLNRILADRGAMGCVGSACALWVPEIVVSIRTGKGRCADNLHVDVWADPADAKKEHKDTP